MHRQPLFAGSRYEKARRTLSDLIAAGVGEVPGHRAPSPGVPIVAHAGHRFPGKRAAPAVAWSRPGPCRASRYTSQIFAQITAPVANRAL